MLVPCSSWTKPYANRWPVFLRVVHQRNVSPCFGPNSRLHGRHGTTVIHGSPGPNGCRRRRAAVPAQVGPGTCWIHRCAGSCLRWFAGTDVASVGTGECDAQMWGNKLKQMYTESSGEKDGEMMFMIHDGSMMLIDGQQQSRGMWCLVARRSLLMVDGCVDGYYNCC